MPWIQNISLSEVNRGHHFDPGSNSMLIQIVDPCMEFPTPKFQFSEIHQFEFLDLEADDMPDAEEFKITDMQASELVCLLQYALNHRMNVIVHCVAGVARSGAVCEVGIKMGFDDTEHFRNPNLLVKHKMMDVLSMSY